MRAVCGDLLSRGDLTDLTGSTEDPGDGGPPKNFRKAFRQEPVDMPRWKETAVDLSPIRHVHDALPPTLIYHGNADTLVLFDQSSRYADCVRDAGCEIAVREFERAIPGLTDPCRAEIVVHVSTSGDDAWSGDLAAPNAERTDGPVATLGRARDRVRQIREVDGGRRRDEPVRVVVATGRYEISTPLELTAEDGGSAAGPVVYAAADGSRPVISGGRRIAGFPQGSGDESGLWVADLDPALWQRFEQLFVNGRRATLAREPDSGTFAVVACDEAMLGPGEG